MRRSRVAGATHVVVADDRSRAAAGERGGRRRRSPRGRAAQGAARGRAPGRGRARAARSRPRRATRATPRSTRSPTSSAWRAMLRRPHRARSGRDRAAADRCAAPGRRGSPAIPARRGRFVRPLLGARRAPRSTRTSRARALPVWDDPMNDDRAYRARPRPRRRSCPRCARENPQLDDALVRLAAQRRGVARGDRRARARRSRSFRSTARALAAQPAAIRKRALALALEAARARLRRRPPRRARSRWSPRPTRGEVAIDVPGGARRPAATRSARSSPAIDRLDADRSTRPHDGYELRTWRAGDRMRPARLQRPIAKAVGPLHRCARCRATGARPRASWCARSDRDDRVGRARRRGVRRASSRSRARVPRPNQAGSFDKIRTLQRAAKAPC